MVADVAAGHSADATRPAMVVAANPVVATESLRQQLRAHGVGEAEIDQLIVAGFGTAQTRDGRRVVMTRRGSERLVEFSRDRALPSQARATWILIATTAVIIAIVLAFVIH